MRVPASPRLAESEGQDEDSLAARADSLIPRLKSATLNRKRISRPRRAGPRAPFHSPHRHSHAEGA